MTPTAPETSTASSATTSDTRRPKSIRLRTSRPSWSVPSGLSALPPVGHTGWVSSCAYGSAGATSGAATARTSATARSARPATASFERSALTGSPPGTDHRHEGRSCDSSLGNKRSRVADAWVEGHVQDVHQEAEQHDDRRDEEDVGLHDRKVTCRDGVDGQPADARVGEDLLG